MKTIFLILTLFVSSCALAQLPGTGNLYIAIVNQTTNKHMLYSGQTASVKILRNSQTLDTQDVAEFIWYLDGTEIKRGPLNQFKLSDSHIGQRLSVGVVLDNPLHKKEFRSHSELIHRNSPPRILLGIRTSVNGSYSDPISLSRGDLLSVDFDYFDYEGDKQGSALIVFRTNKKVLKKGSESSYRVRTEDVGKKIWVEITPVARTGVVVGRTITKDFGKF